MQHPEHASNDEPEQTPNRRLFLCLRQTIPGFISEKLPFIEEIRDISSESRSQLTLLEQQWQAKMRAGEVGSYMSEVSIMMGAVRAQSREVEQMILDIDRLTLHAYTYADMCAAIRSTTREIAGRLAGFVSVNDAVELGAHHYGNIELSDGRRYFVRHDDAAKVYFDAPDLAGGEHVVHAQIDDHVRLYQDIGGDLLLRAPAGKTAYDVI